MKRIIFFITAIVLIFNIAENSYSNNLKLSNFYLRGTDVEGGIYIFVDSIYWENSWRNDVPGTGQSAPFNHDAVWFFAKYRLNNTSNWIPAKFAPTIGYHQKDPFSQIKPSSDSMGIFVMKAFNGTGTNNFRDFAFFFYGGNIPNNTVSIDFQIFAIETVFIPQDSFYVGDSTTTSVTGQFSASDNISPFKITSEAAITLGGLTPNSLNNRNSAVMSAPDDFNNTQAQTLPAHFPKGYKSFYCMKYEVTAQQYVDFLNSLDTAQARLRYANAFGTERNSIQKAGNKYVTNAPDRANNFMSWADGAAYADWVGLRPMTELEIEKTSRGPLNPIANEYAWGNTVILQITSFNGSDGSGTETALPVNSNCNYNLIDGGAGQPIGGPCRVGIFATSVSDRVTSGATYYGVMDMTGNCWERNVSVGNSAGRLFDGLNGNGLLDAAGNADVLNWPSANSAGTGFRMGNWFRGTERARISDRFYATTALDNRTGHRGFRCVRNSN